MAHGAGKGLLVVDRSRQRIQSAGGLFLDERTPEIEHLSSAFRRLLAGQLLADDHRHGFAERRIFLTLDTGKVRLGVFLGIHRVDVGGNAIHPQRADRFDARLLDGIEYGAGVGTLRRHRRVNARIVTGKTQRHGIAEPAGDRKLMQRRPLRHFRQADALAAHARTFVGKRHLDFAVAGNRAHAASDRPTQRLHIDLRVGLAFQIVSTTCHMTSVFPSYHVEHEML